MLELTCLRIIEYSFSMNKPRILSPEDVAQALSIDFSPSPIVAVDNERVRLVCNQIKERQDFAQYNRERWDNPLFWNVDDTAFNRSQFFAIGNAINFRYWEIQGKQIVSAKGIKKGTEFRGALYMWRCLSNCLEDRSYPILDASFLANISETEFDAIFSADTSHNPLSVGKEERLKNLRDLGSKLKAKWNNSFYNLVEASGSSLIEFSKLSGEFLAYDDPCYKLTMVNAILHSGSGLVKFDADPLPGIDYQLLKQLLRIGILVPTPALATKIKQKETLTSNEASELRRVALNAFVQIASNTGISGEILDNKWWWNRLKCLDEFPVCVDDRTATECPFYGSCKQDIGFTIPLEITRYY